MSENTTSKQLTLLPEDSLVNLTVLQGSEEAQKITAISGRNLAELLERCDHDTSLLRTFLESSPPISTRCYLTWKVRTTPARRLIFQLAPSMPRTDENGYSLWPTLMVGDAKRIEDFTLQQLAAMPSYVARGKRNSGETLAEALAAEFGAYLDGPFAEWIMGFPENWTELEHSEMP